MPTQVIAVAGLRIDFQIVEAGQPAKARVMAGKAEFLRKLLAADVGSTIDDAQRRSIDIDIEMAGVMAIELKSNLDFSVDDDGSSYRRLYFFRNSLRTPVKTPPHCATRQEKTKLRGRTIVHSRPKGDVAWKDLSRPPGCYAKNNE